MNKNQTNHCHMFVSKQAYPEVNSTIKTYYRAVAKKNTL